MNQRNELVTILNDKDSNFINFECSKLMRDSLFNLCKNNFNSLSVVLEQESFYEPFRVKEYLSFFAKLCQHEEKLLTAMQLMELNELAKQRISKLTFSQRRRLSLAREIIRDCDVLFLDEPLLNVDEYSLQIISRWLDLVAMQNKKVISTSISLKYIFLMPGKAFLLEETGVKLLNNQETNELDEENKMLNQDKIAVAMEDKILLFNPEEIDYIESMQGKCLICVRGNSFPISFTLDELEKRLSQYGFFRSHRSYLVNMQKVVEIVKWTRNSYSLKLEHQEDVNIPLSKGRIDLLKEHYHF